MKKVDIQAIRRVPSAIKRIPYKKVLFGVTSLIIVGVLLMAGYGLLKKRATTAAHKACATSAYDEMLNKYNSDKSQEALPELKAAYEKIIKLDQYEKDPNCVYIVATYQTSTGDSVGASKSIKKYEAAKSSSGGKSDDLKNVLDVESLNMIVKSIETNNSNSNANVRTFGQPE